MITSAQNTNIKIGDTIHFSSFELKQISGRPIVAKMPTVIDFWATWCGPCIAAFPHLDTVTKLYQGKVQVLAISDEQSERVNKFVKQHNYSFSIYLDPGKALFRLFAIDARPETAFISADGRLLWVGRSKYLPEVIDSYLTTNEVGNKWSNSVISNKYYSEPTNTSTAPTLINYQINYCSNLVNYLVRSQKGHRVDSAINIEYRAVSVSELLQDMLGLPYLQFNNTREDLDTTYIDLIAKSDNPRMTYKVVSQSIISDLSLLFDFQLLEQEKTIGVYELVVVDNKKLNKYKEEMEGGGMVETLEDSMHVFRLSLDQIAYHLEKKYKVFVTYNGAIDNQYSFYYTNTKNIEEAMQELLAENGLELIKSIETRRFVTIE